MHPVTPSSFCNLVEWYAAAISHPGVSRFLSMSKFINAPQASSYESDWDRAGFLSNSGKTFLLVNIDRDGSEDVGISLWSMADGMQKKIEAGRAILFVRDVVVRIYRPRTLSGSVHGSNADSLKLMQHVFGEPWGIRPVSAWDRGIGAMVDMHCFQKIVCA
jgi:hypothetical protein